MPIRLKFADKGKGVLYLCEGLITGRDFIDANIELVSIPERLLQYRYAVLDATPIGDFNVPVQDIKTLSEQASAASAINPEIIFAVIAVSDRAFGLSRMWELMSSDTAWEKSVFRSKDEAHAWIRERVRIRFKLEIKMDFGPDN